MNKEVYLFQSQQDPDFLVGPRKSLCFNEDLERFKKARKAFMEEIRRYLPEADYPYIALLTDVIRGTDTPCLIRPDSSTGGLRGALEHWSRDYDASTPEGLAKMLYEELSLPVSDCNHMNPITFIVNFGGVPILDDAISILEEEYGCKVKIVEID